jgi:hypothetical protein
MSFAAADIRTFVASMKTTASGVLCTVTHEPFSSRDGDGTVTYGASVSYDAYVEKKTMRMSWGRTGRENIDAHIIQFVENVPSLTNDSRLTMPSGETPPILEINGVQDPAGGQYAQLIICGRPERGVTAT